MGFGILFFACFLTYFGALTPIGIFTYMLGAALMLYALYKLYSLNKIFVISAGASACLMLVSLVVVVMFIFGYDSITFYKVLVYVQNYLAPALLISIHIAIYFVAKEVGLNKIQGWTIVNNVFILGYVVCDILSLFIIGEVATPRFGLICTIAQVLYSLFMLVILFNCYARICYEDDKNMENNSSGVAVFDFLNKMFNRATDKDRKNKRNGKGDE